MLTRSRQSVAVLGVPFDNVTMHEAVDLIEEKIDEQGYHQVATANVDFVMHAIHDKLLQDMLCSCDLIVPDGMPIVWASRLMGASLKERVCGADMVPHLAALSAKRGYGMYLLGACEESSRRAAAALEAGYPGLKIAGRDCPPISPLDRMDHEAILSRIERAKPDILLVAMGHPKQEQWLAMHRHRLRIPLCMGVGATLDFIAGSASRAPIWMQSAGIEWLYRAWQEPGRLGKRYLNDAYGLACHLPLQLAASAIQPRKRLHSEMKISETGHAHVISIRGDLTGRLLNELEKEFFRAADQDCHVVVDLSEVSYLGPDSVGPLLHFMAALKRRGRQVWFVGMSAHVSRVLRAARVKHYFSTTSSVSDALYRVTRGEGRCPGEPVMRSGLNPAVHEVNIQVEVLKDLCERFVTVGQKTEISFRGHRVGASAGRPLTPNLWTDAAFTSYP